MSKIKFWYQIKTDMSLGNMGVTSNKACREKVRQQHGGGASTLETARCSKCLQGPAEVRPA